MIPATTIRNWQFVLATDLDGTFLGGTEADRAALYRAIEARRDRMGLIFVTGRDPGFIEGLCAGGQVPWPDYVVGDVGTTIAALHNRRVAPMADLERPIAEAWGDRGADVRAALSAAKGLTLQPTEFRYRVSYDYDPATYDGTGERIVAEMGLDALISADIFFDVLPKGISKGPSLLRLVDHLGVDPARVLAAGDTLNDLSMLECGLPAVAVGGSEPALIERVAPLAQVHKARAIGAAGIAEAMALRAPDLFA
jgi:HAD superfamily hydrolase (TIGR01484 family)